MKKKEKKVNEKKLIVKLLSCMAYLIVIMILFICSYNLFKEKKNIKEWGEIESTDEYTYMEISKMSEKFAYYEEGNIGIHFVIEEEETGAWRTYLMAIDEDKYHIYKPIIDYSYDRTDKKPEPIKVYGYPVIIGKDLKEMAIKNIVNFLPKENTIKITDENFEQYLTNSYLDTTIGRKEYFSFFMFATFMLMFIMIGLLIFTIFYKEKPKLTAEDLNSLDKEKNKNKSKKSVKNKETVKLKQKSKTKKQNNEDEEII